jgi:hypothetical protein
VSLCRTDFFSSYAHKPSPSVCQGGMLSNPLPQMHICRRGQSRPTKRERTPCFELDFLITSEGVWRHDAEYFQRPLFPNYSQWRNIYKLPTTKRLLTGANSIKKPAGTKDRPAAGEASRLLDKLRKGPHVTEVTEVTEKRVPPSPPATHSLLDSSV